MCDDNSNEMKRSHGSGDKPEEDPPDVPNKRGRGPSDCLDWSESDSEEEFTPYTQSNPEVHFPPVKKKIFAKKSIARRPLANISRGKKVPAKAG